MKDIVITAGTAIGSPLELARSIKKELDCKAFVLCTDYKTSNVFRSSKYIDEVCHIESNNELEYVGAIKKWYKQNQFINKPILYFTTDTSCFYINNHRTWFEEKFELCLPSSEIIKSYTQKGIAEVKASEAGLTVPKTQIIESKEDIDNVLTSFSFPVILKQRATYLKSGVNFKIKVIEDKGEFIVETTNLINQKNTVLCQEYIPGGYDTSIYYLFYRTKDGVVLDNMGSRIFQTTPDGGLMAKGKTEFIPEVSQMSKSFLDTISYFGMGGLEFKRYENKYYFIEMNIRTEAILKIAETSNTPLALLSYYDLSNNLIKREQLQDSKQKDGIIYMDFIMTIVARIKNKSFLHFFTDVFASLFSPETKLNVFSTDDPKPFFMTLKNLIAR